MFGGLANMLPSTPSRPIKNPDDVPSATPINLPRCQPQVRNQVESENGSRAQPKHLAGLLQSVTRPTELSVSHLEALGVHVTSDAPLADLIPDVSCVPDFTKWDDLPQDQALAMDAESRPTLGNGRSGPGTARYAALTRELAINNEAAFRAVRRLKPAAGTTQARLGNSYEFFRHLESFTDYWDDTSAPEPPKATPPASNAVDRGVESTAPVKPSVVTFRRDSSNNEEEDVFPRTKSGDAMHPSNRVNITNAFVKLVAYDFGCNVSSARMEPRLYLRSPAQTSEAVVSPSNPARRHSYFTSSCSFIFRSPTSRDACRSGVLEGPLAAVSPRHNTSFPPQPSDTSMSATDQDSVIDLARELLAALITAQHRARKGKTEKRIGENTWWTTKRRWGGGTGGPIGRESESMDRDEILALSGRSEGTGSITAVSGSSQSNRGQPQAKKARKGLTMYDNYRMVRPPSMHWDPKTAYDAIGRRRGVDYDDIFVMSCLFHHISVLRVRVPHRLLEVLDGGPDDGKRSWGKVEVIRSKWFDLFKPDERIEAMRTMWATMAYMMRKTSAQGDGENEQCKFKVDVDHLTEV